MHVSKFYKEGLEGKYLSNIASDAKTLYETFRKGAKISSNYIFIFVKHKCYTKNVLIVCEFLDNGKCLGWRENISKPFQWIHYNETLLRARNFGSGILGLNLPKTSQNLIGIYSRNCPEWILTEQAAYCFSMVVVPLYDTLGPESCAFIINQGMKIMLLLIITRH